MKKLLAFIALSFFVSQVFADYPGEVRPPKFHDERIATSSAASGQTLPGAVVICTGPATIFLIGIATYGAPGAGLEFFDSVNSTNTNLPNVKSLYGKFDTSSNNKPFPPIMTQVVCSSGLTVSNSGTSPASWWAEFRRN